MSCLSTFHSQSWQKVLRTLFSLWVKRSNLQINKLIGFLAPKILMLFRFQIYWLRTYPMKVITEMRCTQYIRYLRFYYQTADNQLIAFAKLCWQGRRFRYFSFTWIKLGIRYCLLKNEHRFNLHNIWHGLLMNTWVAVSLLVFIVYFNHFSAISWLPDIG